MRHSWSPRHPELAALLEASGAPIASEERVWGNGTLPLRIAAFTTVAELPDELVSSIRCIVRVGGKLVVSTGSDGDTHLWPGGRREQGESWVDTAVREVGEETAWRLDRASVRQLGWLHFEHLAPLPPDWSYPNPDFLQVVLTGVATDRVVAPSAEWVDTDGYELKSRLVTVEKARRVVTEQLSLVFLDLLDG